MATNQWLHNFYKSREWTTFRMMLIQERGPYCSRCGLLVGNSTELIGHHKEELTPENVHDRSISLNPDKVELICRDCHDKEHKRFGYENTGRQVYIVYGPPLSGKSTYVQQNKGRNDLVVDMNLLFSAATMLPEYDKPDSLLPIIRGIHNQLIDNIRTRFGKWHDAWIVGGYADKYQREKTIKETGAHEIFMDVCMDECISRLRTDIRLRFRQAEYEQYIRNWFDKYHA